METLTMNDGKALNGHVLLSGGTLWFYLNDVTFSEAYEIMSDPGKTVRITANSYGAVMEYSGYVDLFCLRRENDGTITGGLNMV